MPIWKNVVDRNQRRYFFRWLVISSALNLFWEIAQLPLYQIPANHLFGNKIAAVLHCTLGDAAISATLYATTCILLKNACWIRTYYGKGLILFILQALAFTVYSEWHNTIEQKNWAYASVMPTFAKIGAAPLLQWLLLPIVTTVIIRKRYILRGSDIFQIRD